MAWNRNQDNTLEYLNIYECCVPDRELKLILNATVKKVVLNYRASACKKVSENSRNCHSQNTSYLMLPYALSITVGPDPLQEHRRHLGTEERMVQRCSVWHSQGKGTLPVGSQCWWMAWFGDANIRVEDREKEGEKDLSVLLKAFVSHLLSANKENYTVTTKAIIHRST